MQLQSTPTMVIHVKPLNVLKVALGTYTGVFSPDCHTEPTGNCESAKHSVIEWQHLSYRSVAGVWYLLCQQQATNPQTSKEPHGIP